MSRKLRAVIRHEYLTIVKQPAFLLTMLALPVIMGAIFSLSFFAERTAQSTIEEATSEVGEVLVVDESDRILPEVAAAYGLELRTGSERAGVIESVKAEEIDGAIIYPADILDRHQFEVHLGGGDDYVTSSALTSLGQQLLQASLAAPLGDPALVALLQQGASGVTTAYEDGVETPGAAGYVVPGIFLGIFFIILFFSMGYMLLGVAEEKENRSMEMVLSYLRPRTLITGKLFGVSLVALTQLLFFLLLGVVGLFTLRRFEDAMALPIQIEFSALVIDPVAIAIGLITLILGFLLFAALMSGVASMAPGVKEANSFSSIFFMLPFVPFWSFGMIMAAPHSTLVAFLTYFPITAPTTLLARNTLGNIGTIEAAGAIAVLAISTVLAFALAAKLFRLGALEYADRLKLSRVFKR